MILDATAGNRTMWINKHSDNIIYIDMETQLEVKPTIFCDNTKTPFRSAMFDTIFYDPPHTWGNTTSYHCYPNRKMIPRKYDYGNAVPRYYGWDKYKDRGQLTMHIFRAQKEFQRILKEDGLLWIKWNVMSIQLSKILSLLNDWRLLLKIHDKDPSQTAGEHQTYWLCMEKIKQNNRQLTL